MKKMIIGIIIGMMAGSISTVAAANLGEVQAVFANFIIKVNGKVQQPDITPLVYDGTSYLPVRAMASLVGFDVSYITESRTIELMAQTVDPPIKSEPIDETKWVSLLELIQYGLKTSVSPGTAQIKIEYGSQVFTFNLPNTMTAEKMTTSTPGDITMLIKDGTTYLNRSDLERLGLPHGSIAPPPVVK